MNLVTLVSGITAAVKAEIPTMHIPSGPLIMPTPPSFVVFDFDVTPHRTMRFFSEVDLTARVVISRADADQSAADAEAYMGDGQGSIFYALEKPHILSTGAQTFGGACDDAIVTRVRGYRQYVYGTTPFVGFEILIHAVGERSA